MTVTLRPYQVEADAAIQRELYDLGRRSTLLVAATGSGKTQIALTSMLRVRSHGGRVLFLAHRDELIQQPRRKLEALGIVPDVEKGKQRASLNAKIVIASVQSLRGVRLARFARDHFDLIIVDECFPAGTLVDGRAIETLRVGDLVSSVDHRTGLVERRPVLRRFASRPMTMVRVVLDDGRAIDCTAGHPFFTGNRWTRDGYVPAVELQKGDSLYGHHDAMHRVQIQDRCGHRQEPIAEHAAHGSSLVLEGMLRDVEVSAQFRDHGAHEPQARLGPDDRAQPHAHRGDQEASIADVAQDGTRSQGEGREWHRTHQGRGDAVCGARPGLGDQPRLHDEDGQGVWLSEPLQDRSGSRSESHRGGGGWPEPQLALSSRARRQETGVARIARVARVEIHERGSDGGFGSVCPDGLVYNIEVEGNHNYFVGGILVHNCHHASASGYRTILDHFLDAKVLGVTATPDRADGQALGEIFESVAFRYEIREAIRDQWLVPITARRVVVDSVDLSGIATRAGDLAQDQLAEVMETERAIRGVVMPLLELAGDLTTIVFGVDVEHARLLDQALNDERPGCSRWISGETEQAERDRLTEGHNAGEYQYLCNCDVLSEGYDSPRVACVAIAAPTKSRARYVQRCGRATRILGATLEESIQNGKPRALILDFTGQAGRHRLAGPVDCLAGSDQGMDAFGDDLRAELDALLGTQQIELEAALARADESAIARRAALDLDAVVSFHAEQIDPFLGSPPRAAAPQIALGWADKAPSDAQVKALDAAGVTITRLPPSFSAADATRLLIRLRARREAGLCSLAQAKRLHAAGIRGTAVIRFERATQLITKLREAGWGRPWVIWGEPEAQTEASLAAIDAIRARSAAKRLGARLVPGDQDISDHESLP